MANNALVNYDESIALIKSDINSPYVRRLKILAPKSINRTSCKTFCMDSTFIEGEWNVSRWLPFSLLGLNTCLIYIYTNLEEASL